MEFVRPRDPPRGGLYLPPQLPCSLYSVHSGLTDRLDPNFDIGEGFLPDLYIHHCATKSRPYTLPSRRESILSHHVRDSRNWKELLSSYLARMIATSPCSAGWTGASSATIITVSFLLRPQSTHSTCLL